MSFSFLQIFFISFTIKFIIISEVNFTLFIVAVVVIVLVIKSSYLFSFSEAGVELGILLATEELSPLLSLSLLLVTSKKGLYSPLVL